MVSKSEGIHEILANIPELESYTSIVNGNTINITLNLIHHEERERTTFDIEAELTEKLEFLKQKGFDVSISTVTNSSSTM
jgi:multidrug efflux pump subunit AcrB